MEGGGGELMHSYVNCSGVELYKKNGRQVI